MAMQELASAPFRVVDEINQGMDERNERLVFDRIVQSCCTAPASMTAQPTASASASSPSSQTNPANKNIRPQYFLVSPKLLQGLRAMQNDDVTVLMVWNGPGVAKKWQLNQVIRSMKRPREGSNENRGTNTAHK